MISPIYEDGYYWIEFSEEAWSNATFTTYINGMDID